MPELSSSSEIPSSCNADPQPSNNYDPSSDNFQPHLTDELENMIKILKLDYIDKKISNDNLYDILKAVIDCLIYYHYNSIDIELLKFFFFEFQKEICENPLGNEELEDLWVQQTAFIEVSSDDEKNPSSIKPPSIKQEHIQQSETDLLQPELDAVISKGDV